MSDHPAPIVIVDYDPSWPALYEQDRRLILEAVGDRAFGVEHIGSTAVSGLPAKPVIDIMLGLRTLDDAPACMPGLESIGYRYLPAYEQVVPERRFFRKPTDGEPSHHLHVVEVTSWFWERTILFRDHLRRHPDVAQDYVRLKRALAERFGSDRHSYSDAKTHFIVGVVARAKAEREAPR
jgi:GrpB-like predicted nucleotidyltransferase (UPF0157 family)